MGASRQGFTAKNEILLDIGGVGSRHWSWTEG
jgi:hypothetical protein